MERCPNPLDLRRTLSLLEGFPNYQPDSPRGLFRTGQGEIALVVREASDPSRHRTAFRQLAEEVLAEGWDGALWILHNSQGNYRLGYLEFLYQGRRKPLPLGRSILVRAGHPNKTACQRLGLLESALKEGRPLDLPLLREALSVDAVTEDFYREFVGLFEKSLGPAVVGLEESRVRDFLLGFVSRTLFLAFVAKRGWLGGREDFLPWLLGPERGYRPGEAFWSYLEDYRAGEPLAYRLYLPLEELLAHQGPERLRLVDASRYREGKGYALRELGVDRALAEALRRSPLYLRTLDSGTWEGRAGIRPVSELGGEGVFHSGHPHRTHPIAVRFQGLDREGALLAAQAFDVVLEHFRASCRSLFLSDYKGSRAAFYPRKYLGLQTAKALLDTLPQRLFSPEHRRALREALASGPEALQALRERVGG